VLLNEPGACVANIRVSLNEFNEAAEWVKALRNPA
ncbi:MAG: hypothetical protein RL226_414, partial [Bacteroidota bacterium]